MTIYTTTIAKTETRSIDWEKLPMNAKEKIIAYGVQRIFNDMVGGSERFPTIEDKMAHVDAQIARFMAGDIGRAQSASVPTATVIARQLVRAALKAQLGAKSPQWAKFTGLDDDAQAAKLDEVFEKNKAKFQPEVDAELKRREAAAKSKAKLADKLEFDL